MKGIPLAVVMGICFFSLLFAVRQMTHNHAVSPAKTQAVNKALDDAEKSKSMPNLILTNSEDCYPKEAFNIVAVDASKHTVDFIVNKMITDKFIIVSKDGFSYRFKLVKKYKTKAVKK